MILPEWVRTRENRYIDVIERFGTDNEWKRTLEVPDVWYQSVSKIKAKAKDAFFSVGNMEMFQSRVGFTVFGGCLFITSERQRSYYLKGETQIPRVYSVRLIKRDETIGTVGEHGMFSSNENAKIFAGRLARDLGRVDMYCIRLVNGVPCVRNRNDATLLHQIVPWW